MNAAPFSSMEIGFGGAKRPFFYRKNSTDEQVIKEAFSSTSSTT